MPKIVSKSQADQLQNIVDSKKGSNLCFKGSIATIKPKDKGKPKPIEKDALKHVKIVKVKKEAQGLSYIKRQLKLAGILFIEEFKFSSKRKYRADIALIGRNILIEYEGLVSPKSGHTTITGYTKDCDKYNLATSLGYKVYRYTALNYKTIHDLIKELV